MNEKHLTHYLVLLVGLFGFSIIFVYFRYSVNIQIFIAALGSAYYALWGIIHHMVEGRLNKLVVGEYILIGLLVFCLLFFALYL